MFDALFLSYNMTENISTDGLQLYIKQVIINIYNIPTETNIIVLSWIIGLILSAYSNLH